MSALYRTHRPLDFSQVVGQGHVVRTLSNAIDQDRVAHAYLFAGPRGTGKTSMAKILAKSLNCEQGPTTTPCLVCESCRTIHDATAIDVIEMDAASHRGIDDIREIRDKVVLRPVLGRYKIYIVDEAHMLTKEASNAVLKTLEEPPDHAIFVLCTTEMQAMLPTIRSRCQRFAFHRPTHAETSELLNRIAAAEGIEIDDAAITMVARAGGGSFRDAVSLLDQLQTACSQQITADDARALLGTADEEMLFRALDLVAAGDAAGSLRLVDELAESGADLGSVTAGLLTHLRGLFLTQQLGEPPGRPGDDGRRAGAAGRAGLAAHADGRAAADRPAPRGGGRGQGGLRPAAPAGAGAGQGLPPAGRALAGGAAAAAGAAGERRTRASPARLRPQPPPPAAAPAPPATVAEADPPAAAPEPRNPPPASGDGLMARWEDAVLPEIGRRSPPLRALLDSARPTGVDDGVVTLAFSLSFAKAGASSSENEELLDRGARPGAGRAGQAADRRGGRSRGAGTGRRGADARGRAAAGGRVGGRPVRPDQGSVRRPRGQGVAVTKMDPNKMMAELGKMQQQMEQAQEQLKTEYVEHSAGGGAVTVKMSGSLEVSEVTIKPEAIDPDDPEMLQDLLVSAFNGALAAAQQLQQQRMMGQLGGLGGLGIPGL